MSNFLSVTDVAKILKISRQAVHKGIKAGRIEAVKIGSIYRISEDWLDNFINTGGNK